ncbi:hypothetical protein MANES_05G207200v8 [Manihot esculenta]|uniref:Uncharacterized protein n=1 Tax=Manihot esculenta TaxID=3983 RepID=A0A2C9VY69_MANES|nr:hypothetical protein MANES_05G207200v8 [Manihot esculenta]
MEGLIPLVYKAMKSNKSRRQYECLSSAAPLGYNPSDFYINEAEIFPKPGEKGNNEGLKLQRRFSSVGDLSAIGSSPPRQQLVRFGSHRMFSCVTGG